MNLDFHYYGTYLAARIAGFNKEEAETIAYASQYVDESTISSNQIPTVQTNTEISLDYKGTSFSELTQYNAELIWCCFHFLPGNFADDNEGESRVVIHKYNGVTEDNTSFDQRDSWTFDKYAEEQFKLLCRPNSNLSTSLINDIISYKETPFYLHMLGMRMHTFADTWAHQDFAGISAWFLNGIKADTPFMPCEANKLNQLFFRMLTLPDRPYYNSASYLGHGQHGHYPDYGYLKYMFTPVWNGNKGPIVRDNTKEFLEAFKCMVLAMRRIREGNKYTCGINEEGVMSLNEAERVKKVMETYEEDQTKAWINAIKQCFGEEDIPIPFTKEAWSHSSKLRVISNADQVYFNTAALMQIEFITNYLKQKKIYIGETSKARTFKVRLKSATMDKSVGTAYVGWAGNYPKMDDDPQTLCMITAVDKAGLESGDVVEIRTDENKDPNKSSFWLATHDSHVMYHHRNAYIDRTRWKLILPGEADGTPIKLGDQIYIQNVHFEKYLRPETDWYECVGIDTTPTKWSISF